MGENWYCRANRQALFEIPKPTKSKGIGIDSLPESVRNSNILTGNNLGRLGNAASIPRKEEIEMIRQHSEIKTILDLYQTKKEREQYLHLLLKKYIEQNDLGYALKIAFLE